MNNRTYKKPPCVIIACGSFSPPTYLHLRIMEEAKIRLKSEYEVIGGILSPVNDQYGVIHKESLKQANGTHRIEMVKLATSSSSWLGVSSWEVNLDKWTRVALVLDAYSKALNLYFNDNNNNKNDKNDNDDNKNNDDKKIYVKFLGGSDLLQTMKRPNLWKKDHQEIILGHHGMAVMERKGYEMTEDLYNGYEMFKKHRNNLHVFHPRSENTISSTIVRDLIKEKHSIKYLLPDNVIEYIKKEKLYGYDYDD